MNSLIEQYWQRFQLLSQRERLMVVGAILVLLWGLWDNLFLTPLLQARKTMQAEISGLQSQLRDQQFVLNQLKQRGNFNPNDEKKQQLSRLSDSLEQLKTQLNAGEKRFVPAEQMAKALSDMLKQNGNLQLVKLETLPVKPFAAEGDATQPVWVYRHGLVLTLQGDFFSTLDYLKALENLPWRIYWDSIDYQVKEYPVAETRIQVDTLSFEQDWLGV